MTWEELREHCLSLPGATETFPFEPTVSVFKAANGKMFEITTEGRTDRHQRHWITTTLNGDVPDERVRELVLDSYELVAPKAPVSGR